VHVSADDLIAALRGAGLRATASRIAVCRVIARSHGDHLTAAVITNDLKGTADQSTVYRTLDALEAAGVLTHTHLGHGPSVYHLADEPPHQHLVCERCGAAAEIDPEHLAGAVARIAQATGFVVDSGHFALSGLCRDCAGE
jgi:Fe2+ or Zn2+ uptake regulation protein